jgi:hypothetical protein
MVWIGVANLPPSAANSHANGSEGVHHFETAGFVVWAMPTRPLAQHAAPRIVQCTEEQTETETKASPNFRLAARPGSKRNSLSASQSLSVISPDHLMELPGTPPPALRL